MIDKKLLLRTDRFIAALDAGQNPEVGIDVAVNATKGLRLIARVEKGLWQQTLRFKKDIRLQADWPYINLPSLQVGKARSPTTALPIREVFNLEDDDAAAVARCLDEACVVAVDAPRRLAEGEDRRPSET